MEENEGVEAQAAEEKAKGRPRPQVTVELDERVAAFIESAGAAGVTKEAIAESLDVPANKAYLALYRLRVENKIHKVRTGRTAVWKFGAKPEAAPGDVPAEGEAA